MEVDCMGKSEQFSKSWGLRNIESETFIVVEMARVEVSHPPPSVTKANGYKNQPTVFFRKFRNRVKEPYCKK